MRDNDPQASPNPRSVGYAIGREGSAWPVVFRARAAAEDAKYAYELVKAQVVYAALIEGASVREIADAFDIPKSEVGRIARRVRPLRADEIAGPAAELGARHRWAQQLNELWNGPGAEPLPGAPQRLGRNGIAKLMAGLEVDQNE